MTSREFCYWLQGHFELNGGVRYAVWNGEQVEMVRRHLALVFKHEIDPSYENLDPEEAQDIHDGIEQATSQIGGTGPNGEVMRC